ncbi:hypothetical protein E2562_008638 [Oryza meyeriana var. granulata]|uniref:protein-serine/threonine phosphatase n=1 Tax=Oryza meyeriana var. granulata TaxID=110450 RepID=A0A6G1F5F2_9ORYZ|nr:hypothetical protein E2562_008638 [Oryza meyeriana var. granulata]
MFDGHNGNGAAIYTKENLLNNILSAIPADLNRENWLAALPRAMVAAFVKTDKDFQTKARSSGTTVTFVIIDGLVITVASVGDSRCVLEAEGSIYHLSADHRFDASKEEVDRVTESGGDVGRLNVVGGAEIGPLRCWPGGLCLSRSIGDQDVGEFIVPVPYVKQIKLSTAGGRLIISSDGVWDVLTAEVAFNCSRALPPEAAAEQIVKEAVQAKGLRDDTTCIVVDILTDKANLTMPPPKKQPGMGVFKNMFRKKTSSDSSSHTDREYMDPDTVEEIFEDGCALLSRRLDSEYPTDEEFHRILERAKPTGALVVVDFFRPSCGSCKYIEQGFMKLCKGSGDDGAPVVFLKHNVIDEYDEQSEVAERLRIKVVPLFHFYKDGVLLEAFATRDKERIIAAIRKYTSPSSPRPQSEESQEG